MPRCGLLLLAAVGAACAGCLAVEGSLVYQPRATLAADVRPAPPGIEDVWLTLDDGRRMHARWCPYPGSCGAVLYCHGNAGNLEGRARVVRELWEAVGESVLIVDYPGYGRSEGTPDEAGCYAAALAAYDWLRRRGLPAERVVLVGESLGGGVAVEVARQRKHRALVLVRTFTSLPDVVRSKPAIGPLAGWMRNRFDNLARIGACPRPIFIAEADRDEVVGPGHAEKLLHACRSPARSFTLRDCGHNDPLGPEFYAALRQFLAQIDAILVAPEKPDEPATGRDASAALSLPSVPSNAASAPLSMK